MDAISLLTQDHREVEDLFEEWDEVVGADADTKRDIVQEVIRLLSIHAAIEEQFLYPTVKEEVAGGESLQEEALREHQEAKELFSELDKMSPDDADYDARVEELIRDVRHHVAEEEGELFPKLRQAIDGQHLEDMGQAMDRAKGIAPTRPHPRAPSTPPGNLAAGLLAGPVDRVRDAVTRRGARKRTSQRQAAGKKAAARKTGARKSAGGKKATGAKKSTAKKSTAKRSSAGGRSSRKTSSRRSSS